MPDKKTIIRIVSYTAYFLLVFIVFLLLLFPYERLKTKIESEVRARTLVELSIGGMAPRFINRFVLSDVVVSDAAGAVLFESKRVSTSVSLFQLLRGVVAIDLSAAAYGGTIQVNAKEGKGIRNIAVDATDLDIGAYALLKQLGIKITGKMGGTFEMSGDAGKGRVWIKGLATREIQIVGFSVPDLDFDQCWLDADLRGDRMTVKKFDLDGKELKVRVAGDLVLRERGTLNLLVKIRPSERLAREQSGLLSFVPNKDAEGFHQFTLGGTLSQPLPRL